MTNHKLIIGNCMSMQEIADESVHLMVTSPPYFNAPFDYKGLFKNYDQYLGVLNRVAREVFRVLKKGETVLDPFAVSGTTMKVARQLGRNSIGIEIKRSLIPIIKEKLGFKGQLSLDNKNDVFEVTIREGVKYGCVG